MLKIPFILIFIFWSLSVSAKCIFTPTRYCPEMKVLGPIKPISRQTRVKGEPPSRGMSACEVKMEIRVSLSEMPMTAGVLMPGVTICPKRGTSMTGTLVPLCQDTGRFTNADYRLQPETAAYCNEDHLEKLKAVRKKAGALHDEMSAADVAAVFSRQISVNARGQNGEIREYYEHPAIVVKVPFERLADKTKMNGRAEIRRQALDRLTCEKQQGKWGTLGMMGTEQCNLPTLDKSKECTDNSQCESVCFTENKIMPGQPSKGGCYGWTSVLGTCLTTIKEGIVQHPLCVD
jgi:hypothetical protein